MVRDVEANAPWQRLRRNLLLVLQLLFLAALILSLARPFTWAEGPAGQALIVVVDTSASMAATDGEPGGAGGVTRLEAATARALAIFGVVRPLRYEPAPVVAGDYDHALHVDHPEAPSILEPYLKKNNGAANGTDNDVVADEVAPATSCRELGSAPAASL